MRLINVKEIEEITGLGRITIGKKVTNNTFPKQSIGNLGDKTMFLWDEKKVIDWLNEYESSVLYLNKRGCATYTISKRTHSTKVRVRAVLEKHGIEVSEERKQKQYNQSLFNLVLQTSAQLTNNRGI